MSNDLVRRCRLIGYNAACAAVMWPMSYAASADAAGQGRGLWFAAVSFVSLCAAMGTTFAALVMLGFVIVERKS